MKKPKGTKAVMKLACGCVVENWFPYKVPAWQLETMKRVASEERCDKHKEAK